MTKRKLILLIVAVALVATTAVGGTLAWFTDVESSASTLTMGNVKIEVRDDVSVSSGKSAHISEGEGMARIANLVPGDIVSKVTHVTNIGANDAYIRLKITIGGITEHIENDGLENYFAIVGSGKDTYEGTTYITTKNWAVDITNLEIDTFADTVSFYAYFTPKLTTEGEYSKWKLDYDILVPSYWGNAHADSLFVVAVEAQAVQAANFSPKIEHLRSSGSYHADYIVGWPDLEITPAE